MWNGLSRDRFAWWMAGFGAGRQQRGQRWTRVMLPLTTTCIRAAAWPSGGHDAPGHGGSADHHTDVRGSKPQVASPQEGAPD
jgi:hypothetical protein